MSSRFVCKLKIENSTFSLNKAISLIFVWFSIDISALLIVLVTLEGKPFCLCFSTFNISSDTTFEASLMIKIFQKCSKNFKNFREKKNSASQTNQNTIQNDVTNSNTKRQIKTKEFIFNANTWYYLKRNLKQYFDVCNLF